MIRLFFDLILIGVIAPAFGFHVIHEVIGISLSLFLAIISTWLNIVVLC